MVEQGNIMTVDGRPG